MDDLAVTRRHKRFRRQRPDRTQSIKGIKKNGMGRLCFQQLLCTESLDLCQGPAKSNGNNSKKCGHPDSQPQREIKHRNEIESRQESGCDELVKGDYDGPRPSRLIPGKANEVASRLRIDLLEAHLLHDF